MGCGTSVEDGYLHETCGRQRRGDHVQLQRRSLWVSHCFVKVICLLLLLTASSHDAQICYCGEPNCVGTIGGKTQTDIGGMGDLLIEGQSFAFFHMVERENDELTGTSTRYSG